MLQIIDKSEIAERKPYRYSDKVSAKMRKERKAREMKRKNMARCVTRIDAITEMVEGIDDDVSENILDSLLEN